jgi:hypothetical protein
VIHASLKRSSSTGSMRSSYSIGLMRARSRRSWRCSSTCLPNVWRSRASSFRGTRMC